MAAAIPGPMDVRKLARSEIDAVIGWAINEGWNPGIHDAEAFYAADPDGFFGIFDEKGMAGCYSIVRYQGDAAFGGFYMVRPDLRSSGIGRALLEDALKRAEPYNLGIDGVINMVPKYQRSGFIYSHENVRFQVIGGGRMPDELHIIEELTQSDLEEFDSNYFPSRRGRFLDAFIDQPSLSGLAAMDGENIIGYGLMRKCHKGRKIGPLFAQDKAIAKSIAKGLLSIAPYEEVFLDVPLINPLASELAQELGMAPVFRTARLYSKYLPKLKWEGVFGITTFELG